MGCLSCETIKKRFLFLRGKKLYCLIQSAFQCHHLANPVSFEDSRYSRAETRQNGQ